MFTTFTKGVLAILVMGSFSVAHADSHNAACKIESERTASLRLIEVRTEMIDGRSFEVGRFEATARGKVRLTLSGLRRDFGFLIEPPVASVQRYQRGWIDTPLFIGSYDSYGDSRLQVSGGNSPQLFIRVSEGLPAGRHKMRVIVRSVDGRCIASKTFHHEVRSIIHRMGMDLHAAMRATSPAHRRFQRWRYLIALDHGPNKPGAPSMEDVNTAVR